MIGYLRHLPRQLPVAAALGRAVLGPRRGAPGAPGREIAQAIAPISRALIRDYVAHVGGDPAAYRTTVPPHLFPHWGLPLAARTLAGVPYPLARVINGGCTLEVHAPLPADRPLEARAQLMSIDDDGRRAVLVQRVITGTAEVRDAVVATIRAVVPLARSGGTRTRVEVPHDAVELARWHLAGDAGLAFALLTGDFNPIHWSGHAGVAAGFGGPILHGFAMFARAIEGVVRARFSGDVARVRAWDAQFTRPLRLPADVGLFARADQAWIGDARGGAAYLTVGLQ